MSRLWAPALLLVLAVMGQSPRVQAQSNDSFASRLTLTGSAPIAVSNNLHAGREAGEPNHAGASVGRSLWYTWTAPTTGTVNLSTYYTGSGAPTMRALAVYTGSSLASLSEVASSNNQAQSLYAAGSYSSPLLAGGTSVNVPVTAGSVYQIAVDAVTTTGRVDDDGTTVLAINAPPTIISSASVLGTVGASFTYTITATGGANAYTATGLPAGLLFNPATGQITGTPSVLGMSSVALSATGPGGTGTAMLTLQINEPAASSTVAPTITSAVSARAFVGAAFSYTITASGSPTSFATGSLPPGLSFNAVTGAISGTPSLSGTYAVPISAGNAAGTANAFLTVVVSATPPPPVITSALAASGTVGTALTYFITTNVDGIAGAAPTAWTATKLPPGMTKGVGVNYFTGTPTQAGTYAVPLTVTSAAGTRSATVTMTILPKGTVVNTIAPAPPVLGSFATAYGITGTTLTYTLTATNAPTAFTAGGLPAGLRLSAATGVISGTPTVAGTFSIPVTAANSYGTSTGILTLTIYPDTATQAAANGNALPILISPASAVGYAGMPFTYTATAAYQGVASYAYPWTFSATNLPPGVTLSSTSTFINYVTISGTPTVAGTYTATISVTYPPYSSTYISHPAVTSSATVTFIVLPAASAPPTLPVITSAAAQTATATQFFYGYNTTATNNPTSYSASGLPPGLSIGNDTGQISGTPTVAGVYPVVVSATNASGTGSATVTFTVAPMPLPVFYCVAQKAGRLGDASFSYPLAANNSPTGYSASGLPPGLSLDAVNGTIHGTPTQTGTYIVPVSATNSSGTSTATLTIMILAELGDGLPEIVSDGYVTGTVGDSISYGLQYYYGNSSTIDASKLPPGLSYNPQIQLISGVPSSAGNYPVPVSVTGPGGTINAVVTFGVAAQRPPIFTGPATAGLTVGTYAGFSFAPDHPASVTSTGTVPGMTAVTSYPAHLDGTPTTPGVYHIGVAATNAAGTTNAVLTVTVLPAGGAATGVPVFSGGAALETGMYLGADFRLSLAAYPAATSYVADGLPPGLSIDAATGLVTGVPTAVGQYQVTVTATNAAGSADATMVFAVITSDHDGLTFIESPASVLYQDHAFSLTITQTHGVPAAYAASGLPPGLSIDPATGIISGTPTTPGTYSVQLTDTWGGAVSKMIWTAIVKAKSALHVEFTTSTAEIACFTGSCFSSGFGASSYDGTSYTGAPLTYTCVGLPPGVTFYNSGIEGTPTKAGRYPVTVTATTAGGVSATAVATILVTDPPAWPATSAAEAVGNVYAPFSFTLTASTFAGTVTYACGTLPAGLVLNSSTGAITGTPATAGTYTVPVMVTSVYGVNKSALTIRIDPPLYGGLPVIASAPSISSQDFPPDSPSLTNFLSPAVSYALTALNGPASLSMGGVPAGMEFNPSTGVLSGTPVMAGTYRLPMTATNSVGTVGTVLTLIAVSPRATVRPALAYGGYVGGSFTSGASPLYLPAFLSSSAIGAGYSTALDPIVYSATGLPTGLTINNYTGQITGSPTQAGTYAVTLTAINRGGSGSAVTTFAIATTAPPAAASPVWSGKAEAVGFLGVPMSYTLTASSATNYAATGLPAGLSLNASTGVISGTPTMTGTSLVTVSAGNSAGTTQAALTVTIEAAPFTPVVSSSAAATATIGSVFTYNLATTNFSGLPAATGFSTVPSALPAGLSLNLITGVISGTPTGPAGTYLVPITVADGPATIANASLTLVVQPSPAMPVVSSAAGAMGLLANPFSYSIRNAAFQPDASSLPAGLTYDAVNGVISGYPQEAGMHSIPLTVPVAGSSVNASLLRRSNVASGRVARWPGALPADASSATTSVLTVQVLTPQYSLPRLTAQPVGGSAMEGSGFVFSSAAVGVPDPVFQWDHNGIPLAGASSASLTLGPLQPTDTGSYVLSVRTAAGSVTSVPATLLVQTVYARWQTDHFTPSEIAAGLADPLYSFSGDGVSNLVKYAFDLDPRSNASGSALPVLVPPGADGALGISFMRDAGRADLDYVVEASTDLNAWTSIAESDTGAAFSNVGAASVTETAIAGTGQYQVVVKAATPSGRAQFLRVRIARP